MPRERGARASLPPTPHGWHLMYLFVRSRCARNSEPNEHEGKRVIRRSEAAIRRRQVRTVPRKQEVYRDAALVEGRGGLRDALWGAGARRRS